MSQLAARKRIQDLEDLSSGLIDVKKSIVELGVKYRLASKFTRFVGFNECDENGEKFETMVTRPIHQQIMLHPLIRLACSATDGTLSRATYEAASYQYNKATRVVPCNNNNKVKATVNDRLGVEERCLPVDTPAAEEDTFTGSRKSLDKLEMKVRARFASLLVDTSDDDDLTTLINLQRADGHFEWSDKLFLITFVSERNLEKRQPKYVKSKDLWVTAFVLALLEDMQDRKEIWELVVEKAKKFLCRSLTPEEVQNLITEAAAAQVAAKK